MKGWDGYEPAPIEFLHGRLQELFHEFRIREVGSETTVPINGIQFNDIIAKAKKETYAKYPKHVSNDAIPKGEL